VRPDEVVDDRSNLDSSLIQSDSFGGSLQPLSKSLGGRCQPLSIEAKLESSHDKKEI